MEIDYTEDCFECDGEQTLSVSALMDFTSGEISPRLKGRVDFDKYFNTGETLKNVIVQTHGGIFRRTGTRFVAGLNEYCQQNNLDVKDTWELVYEDKLINRHFAPQWLWLLHLYKFYKGTVVLKSFKSLKKYCSVHKNKQVKKTDVALLKHFVEVDYKLMDHINETIELETLIRKYKNVLS